MLLEMGCLVAGLPLGWALRRCPTVVRCANGTSSVLLCVLLFLLGASLGGNADVLDRMTELGLRGLLLGLCCGLGSMAVACRLHRIILPPESDV